MQLKRQPQLEPDTIALKTWDGPRCNKLSHVSSSCLDVRQHSHHGMQLTLTDAMDQSENTGANNMNVERQ
jgi:hypothetical protein